jgi:hypothetical protein
MPFWGFFFFCGNGVWIQDLTLARQALNYLAHVPSKSRFEQFQMKKIKWWDLDEVKRLMVLTFLGAVMVLGLQFLQEFLL